MIFFRFFLCIRSWLYPDHGYKRMYDALFLITKTPEKSEKCVNRNLWYCWLRQIHVLLWLCFLWYDHLLRKHITINSQNVCNRRDLSDFICRFNAFLDIYLSSVCCYFGNFLQFLWIFLPDLFSLNFLFRFFSPVKAFFPRARAILLYQNDLVMQITCILTPQRLCSRGHFTQTELMITFQHLPNAVIFHFTNWSFTWHSSLFILCMYMCFFPSLFSIDREYESSVYKPI